MKENERTLSGGGCVQFSFYLVVCFNYKEGRAQEDTLVKRLQIAPGAICVCVCLCVFMTREWIHIVNMCNPMTSNHRATKTVSTCALSALFSDFFVCCETFSECRCAVWLCQEMYLQSCASSIQFAVLTIIQSTREWSFVFFHLLPLSLP